MRICCTSQLIFLLANHHPFACRIAMSVDLLNDWMHLCSYSMRYCLYLSRIWIVALEKWWFHIDIYFNSDCYGCLDERPVIIAIYTIMIKVQLVQFKDNTILRSSLLEILWNLTLIQSSCSESPIMYSILSHGSSRASRVKSIHPIRISPSS